MQLPKRRVVFATLLVAALLTALLVIKETQASPQEYAHATNLPPAAASHHYLPAGADGRQAPPPPERIQVKRIELTRLLVKSLDGVPVPGAFVLPEAPPTERAARAAQAVCQTDAAGLALLTTQGGYSNSLPSQLYVYKHGYTITCVRRPALGTTATVLLTPSAKVIIMVEDQLGNPLDGGTVLISAVPLAYSTKAAFHDTDEQKSLSTDAAGRAECDFFPQGRIFLAAEKQGYYGCECEPPFPKLPENAFVTVRMRQVFGVALRSTGRQHIMRLTGMGPKGCLAMESIELEQMADDVAHMLQAEKVILFAARDNEQPTDLAGKPARILMLTNENRSARTEIRVAALPDMHVTNVDLDSMAGDEPLGRVILRACQPDGTPLPKVVDGRMVWLMGADRGKEVPVSIGIPATMPVGRYKLENVGWVDRSLLPKELLVTVSGVETEVSVRMREFAYETSVRVVDARGSDLSGVGYRMIYDGTPKSVVAGAIVSGKKNETVLLHAGSGSAVAHGFGLVGNSTFRVIPQDSMNNIVIQLRE
jgi:hypothetical protein